MAGPDNIAFSDARESLAWFLMSSAAFGALAGAAVSVLAGFILRLPAIAVVAGVLASILAAITLGVFGDVPVRIITAPAAAEYDIISNTKPTGIGGLRRLRAYESMTVRAALGAACFALPIILSVAVAVFLVGGTGAT